MQKLKEFYLYKRVLAKNTVLLKSRPFARNIIFGRDLDPLIYSSFGILHIKASFNNTIISLTNLRGKVFLVKSCGSMGFGSKKKRGTKFAIESTLDSIVSKFGDLGFDKVFLYLNGFAKARFLIVNCLKKNNVKLVGIRDITPNAHNGCRPRKLRRG